MPNILEEVIIPTIAYDVLVARSKRLADIEAYEDRWQVPYVLGENIGTFNMYWEKNRNID